MTSNADLVPKHLAEKINFGACWLWGAARTTNGYGKCQFGGRTWRAHRLIYTLLRGPIPPGLQIDHLCRTSLCVNPEHLEPVDSRTNTMRGLSPVVAQTKQTHCKRGHPFDQANTRIDKRRIRNCRACSRIHARTRYDAEWKFLHTRKWRDGVMQPHCASCGQFQEWAADRWQCPKCRTARATLVKYGLLEKAK